MIPLRSIPWLFLLVLLSANVWAADNRILVMGDSLSAAYGIPTEKSWVTLLQKRLDRKSDAPWQVVNASISGETTDGGVRRLPSVLDEHQPDIVIIELGGNDGLRGFPPSVTRENLASMIEMSQSVGARVLLLGMQMPPNYGERYAQAFREIYPELSREYDTALTPFFLKGVYDREGWMQSDGIHPTSKAQPRLLENVWEPLAGLIDQSDARNASARRSDQ